ncbi:hypothetical protein [Anabaena sp. UHCC 0204]|uniref:phosphoribosyltransferase-like protein n=1 Tax=Anabaena sp. UHCC 0204 TaxID=2590009 RepID=UPI00144587E0|nr:hypothetical protein [Anabaena sp. UHCC 0204]MTJ06892.1 hypothetical protein [Anabaena sp. UHCC 0204]
MSNQHQILLNSIATTIADYRQGEIPVIDPNHVEKWVRQFDKFGFDENSQKVILEQMDRILKNYYISRQVAQEFVTAVLTFQAIFGSNPAKTIKNAQFLRVQTKGNSQNDLLSLTEQSLQNLYGLNFDDCGKSPVIYIYLDDCLYSGNRVRRDIDSWLSNAVEGTTLHLIFLGIHTDGYDYSKKLIKQKAQAKNIIVEFWRLHEFHNNRWKPSRFDCFWTSEISEDESVDRFVQQVNEDRQNTNKSLPSLFRPNNVPIEDNIFSSPTDRKVIESAFLKAGAYIVSLPKNPNSSMRPLGYDYLKSLGFGAILVTYRNIANNCPLALWWGDPNKAYPLNAWYPLFPRIVNEHYSNP